MDFLRRRKDFLYQRIEATKDEDGNSASKMDQREFAALNWAIEYIETHNERIKIEARIDGLSGEEEFLAIKTLEEQD